jgi:D-3-phosphoglycerate dehydrogenase / 2-oxoglutarate reductase
MADKLVYKVVDYVEKDMDWERAECEKMGVDFQEYQLKFADSPEVIEKCGDADFLVVDMTAMTSEVLAGLTQCKVLIRHGIGYDKVDVDACTEQGILFANQASAFYMDVAERAVMLIFAVHQKLMLQDKFFKNSVRQGNWAYHDIYPVFRTSNTTLGIIGCGKIGSMVLRKLKSFGMKFLVCDPYIDKAELDALGVEHTPLETLLAESDIVSLHVPVTDETSGYFDYEKFAMMKKTAVFVNTARGQLVNTKDQIRALDEGLIAGAGIDVHEGEPPPMEYGFLENDNVVCTPHFAWYSEEGAWEIRRMIMDDFRRFQDGLPPVHLLNPEVIGTPQCRVKVKSD